MLGEVGCGNDALRKRNAVVWQEGNFDQVFDAGVVVDLGCHGVDGFDDELGGIVSWRGFGCEDEDAWGERFLGILENAAVEGQNVEQIQVLTLVFVQALDLDVEEGRGIDLNAALFLNDLGEEFLVLVFDRHEFLAELGVFGEGFEFAKLVEIAFPSASDAGGDEVGELGVAGDQPTARGDPVRLVVEFLRIQSIEFGEKLRLEELGVKGCDAVHGMASDDREVGHADHLHVAFFDERERTFLASITRPFLFDEIKEVLVDFKNDLQVAGKNLAEESHAPFLQSFGKQSVIRVGEGAGDDRPGFIPGKAVVVLQETHEFDDRDGGVCVVELDGDFLWKGLPIGIALVEAANDVA